MFKALVNNIVVEATKGAKGKCPHCRSDMIAKCGDIYTHYWAHKNKDDCDSWHESETIWHYIWKKTFGLEYAEKRITKGDIWHIADIKTKDGIILEFQNSPISIEDIEKREEFYGERMLWIINGEKFKKNLTVKDYWEDQDYRELMSLPRPPKQWRRSTPEIKKGENGEFFKWKNPRKSWINVQRPVFLDFGDDSLFRVIEGMGTSQIRGNYVSKKKFILKYNGNYEFYFKLYVSINAYKKLMDAATNMGKAWIKNAPSSKRKLAKEIAQDWVDQAQKEANKMLQDLYSRI